MDFAKISVEKSNRSEAENFSENWCLIAHCLKAYGPNLYPCESSGAALPIAKLTDQCHRFYQSWDPKESLSLVLDFTSLE